MNVLVLADERHPGCVIVEHAPALARIRARVRTRQSDRALASGASPDSLAHLSLRAHQLIGYPTRTALARAIRRLLDDVRLPLHPMHFNVPLCRAKVWRSRDTLTQLADRLTGEEP